MDTLVTLRPLANLDAPCPKCGAEYETQVWIAEGVSNTVRQHVVLFVPVREARSTDQLVQAAVLGDEPREHIRKTCKTCRAVWAAAPLDAQDAAP